MGWTKNRAQIIHTERNLSRIIEERRKLRCMFQCSPIHLVFCDETGFNMHLAPTQAWSHRGVTPSISLPCNRERNISVIAVLESTA
jgi:hypothetical protein